MQIHSKTHTEAKAHKCPHCTKTFVNASYLAQHLRIHLGIKPYRCSYCERCFRQLSHLQQHTRSAAIFFYTPLEIKDVCVAQKVYRWVCVLRVWAHCWIWLSAGCFSAWSLPVRIQIPQCSPSPQHMTVDVGHWPLCLSRMCTCLPVTAGKTRLLHILST